MTAPQPTATHKGVVAVNADVDEARDRFVTSLEVLRSEARPGALAHRSVHAAKGWFTDEFGGIRPERVAIAGAVVLGVVAVGVLRRALT